MIRRFAIPAILFLILAACSSRGPESASDIAVGVYSSMTGTAATFGISTRKGVEMAAAEVNAKGGVLGKQIRLIVEDDQGKPEEAQTAVTKLITRDHVVAVIGENASSRSLAAAPVCQSSQVPMISPSSTNPKVTQIGDYIFRVCFIDPFQGELMARFAYNSLKVRHIAILHDVKNDYSVGLAEVFTKSFTKLGGQITGDESYSEGDTDFSAQLTSLKGTNPEAVFVPGYYTEAGLIARQARKLGLEVPLIGCDGWESPKLWEIGGAALNGCYYSNPYSPDDPSPAVRNFIDAYKKRYSEMPDAVAALGYDAMRLLSIAIQSAGSTEGSKIRDALAATKDFAGVTGNITFDAQRNPIKPAVVLKVQDGKLLFVESVKP